MVLFHLVKVTDDQSDTCQGTNNNKRRHSKWIGNKEINAYTIGGRSISIAGPPGRRPRDPKVHLPIAQIHTQASASSFIDSVSMFPGSCCLYTPIFVCRVFPAVIFF